MAKNLYALGFGLLFGLGLIVAQMTNPAKVLAFLDVAGDWDPSLAWVMASALLVLGVALRRMPDGAPLVADADQQQDADGKCGIDCRLIIGAMLFGAGWGLAGICPGPAIVGLASGQAEFYPFTLAMFAGFFLFRRLRF